LIKLPYPPTINHYYARTKSGRVYITKKGTAYRTLVGQMLMIQGVRRTQGDLEVEIKAFPPDRRKRDVDNLLKALLDSMEHGGAYVNDSQIKKLTIEMMPKKGEGHVEVTIKKRKE